MSNIIRLPSRPPTLHEMLCASLDPDYMAFCKARQQMNRALQAWISKNPARSDVHDEIVGTTSGLTYLDKLKQFAADWPDPGAA